MELTKSDLKNCLVTGSYFHDPKDSNIYVYKVTLWGQNITDPRITYITEFIHTGNRHTLDNICRALYAAYYSCDDYSINLISDMF